MNRAVVITGLPAAGKSHARLRIGGGIDCSLLVEERLRDRGTWQSMRRTARTLLGRDDDAFWPAPGLTSLRMEWTPAAAAAFERLLAALVVPQLADRMHEPLPIEATPVIALELLVRFPARVLLVETEESERCMRLEARLGERRELAARVAAFHRMMYQPARHLIARSSWRIDRWDASN